MAVLAWLAGTNRTVHNWQFLLGLQVLIGLLGTQAHGELRLYSAVLTWLAGADGIVICWAAVCIIPAEARADRQALSLKLVTVFRLRAVRVGCAF